ncbi:uncharacterized protein LOC119671628 [Teleopsis dalmanni]|uniref:uncharacterized protein LOC119671628 n=1 Tax=Teleopsis dalmanni TaxID=139649 RepID=UPI0018CE281F|nr:uncharacterized protein LOC119671628 [Teleopsis dalmanni]
MAQISDVHLINEDSGDITEATNAWALYLEIINNDCSRLKEHLSANSAVDWFGHIIRKPNLIYQYLRYEAISQYEHSNIERAEECAPIEKPYLTFTMAPPREKRFINPRNVVPLHNLKTYAESDPELDDADMAPLPEHSTPEKKQSTLIAEFTPPNSTVKQIESNSDTDEEDCSESKPKRLKRTISPKRSFKYLRRIPTADNVAKRNAIRNSGVRTLLDDTSSEDEAEEVIKDIIEYTPLRYLEVTCTLRKLPHARDTNLVDTPTSTDNAGNCDRKVRIKISYRVRLCDQQLLFALIIYEQANAPTTYTRRNLMLEFRKIENETYEESNGYEEQPAIAVNANEEETITTVESPNTDDITNALETATFSILRTPTKSICTPPPTPVRKPRSQRQTPDSARLRASSSAIPKRSAARSLRL